VTHIRQPHDPQAESQKRKVLSRWLSM
jgi:hypothetical protein